jgi:hypothetical protein
LSGKLLAALVSLLSVILSERYCNAYVEQ